MIGLEFICKVYRMEYKILASLLNITSGNITNWIKGVREIPKKQLPELSKIFNGISPEYFQKELTPLDELRIKIFYIEATTSDRTNLEEDLVFDGDHEGKLLYDVSPPEELELRSLKKQLKSAEKMEAIQENIKSMFLKASLLGRVELEILFDDYEADVGSFLEKKLNAYIEFLGEIEVKKINAVEVFIKYLTHYHDIDQKKWGKLESFPNEKLLAFYKELEYLLLKHNIINS
ncbi:hypothetical protein ABE504_05860 [Paenibacillus oryzisoli]|uniref:hypothetical protein n=1 Tax=Paenibacillus oryzisoli TaxID=1850517 RepID=UPI003D27D48C